MENKKIKYERPIFTKKKKMTFPIQIMETKGKRIVCRQCSSCHACR